MGKKIKAEMDAQRAGFVEGCLTVNGIPDGKANELFDLIDKFAGYGFNKSHAAAYALLAYQTAWLKAHHKPEFFAGSMCYDMALTDKLCIWAEDVRRAGVELLPPCVNASAAEFTVEDGRVRYALGALKGVGEKAMEALVAERGAKPYRSLDDLAERIDPRLLNRRQLESLAAAGALDNLSPDRAAVFAAAETLLAEAARAHDERESGQGGLFGGGAGETRAQVRLDSAKRWSASERMAAEKEAFGFYFSSHPTDRYRHVAAGEGARSWERLCQMGPGGEPERDDRGRPVAKPAMRMTALVEEARWRTSARGNRYMFATCSDGTGQYMASAFDEEPAKALEEAARTGACLLLTVELDRRPGEETPRVTVRGARPLDGLTGNARLRLTAEVRDAGALAPLAELLGPAADGGRGEVVLVVAGPDGPVRFRIGRTYRLDEELAGAVERLPGMGVVEIGPQEQPALRLVS
jgi:DNA polymerase-3 subunit alpha